MHLIKGVLHQGQSHEQQDGDDNWRWQDTTKAARIRLAGSYKI